MSKRNCSRSAEQILENFPIPECPSCKCFKDECGTYICKWFSESNGGEEGFDVTIRGGYTPYYD